MLRIACFLWLSVLTVVPARAEVPPELQPYAVQLRLAFEAHPSLPTAVQQSVVAELAETGKRCLGEMWRTEIVLEPALAGDLQAVLERRTAATAKAAANHQDKVYSLVVSVEAEGFRAAGREWDAATQQLDLPVTAYAADRRELATALWRVAQAAFRPVAIVAGGGTTVDLVARAGDLAPPDADWSPHQPGRLWEPYYRFYGADLAIKKIQAVPFTFVKVDNPQRSHGRGSVLTGLRNPLNARRRRTDVLALAVATHAPASQLQLLSGPRPQAGLEVDVFYDLKKPQRLISDRRGFVNVVRDSARPTPWIHVRSGQEILAKLPMVPGLHSIDILELPDDSLRLKVEGEVAFLQAELMDAVARRATLMATARKRLKAKEWEQVAGTLKQVRELRRIQEFASQLEGIRLNGVESARQARDRAAEARIRKLCLDTEELIKVYLDPDKVKQLEEELNELRKAAEENAELEAKPKDAK